MGDTTEISWADKTFNPWLICSKKSPACENCYAQVWARRFGLGWGAGVPRERTAESTWRKPLSWNRQAALGADHYDGGTGDLTGWQPPRVFCASLADWLDHEVPIEWLADLLELIAQTPYLRWLLLTKRPERWRERLAEVVKLKLLPTVETHDGQALADRWLLGREAPPNVWLGITGESQEWFDRRWAIAKSIPAALHFLSAEPLLGPIKLPTEGLGWVISGGESGPRARPSHPDWFRLLRDQCQHLEVPFHHKQNGELIHRSQLTDELAQEIDSAENLAGNPTEFFRVGKKRAGRLLDGRTWDEVPAVAP